MKIRNVLTALPLLAGALFADALPRVTNHWVANTGGGEDHIQNFLEEMIVYYPPDQQFLRPLVVTKSFWDEGHCSICAYYEGRQYGKAEWWASAVNSRQATRMGVTCSIGNFYGRAFLGKIGAPPVGDSAPFVACTGHDTIRTIEDPTALAFDMKGNLLVADNGKDQNIKIFDLGTTKVRLMRTFGDSGGVFAGPRPGAAGVRRFWGPRGLGVDSSGNIYVGTTGMPMQVGGGTDIRVYNAGDSSLRWQVQGLSFVNSGDADPTSEGTSVHLNSERYEMDLAKVPGKSWKMVGATIDPFRYPDDPRLTNSMESVFSRRIEGKEFLYLTDMYNSFAAVVRFEPGSEIGIPTAFFCLGKSGQEAGIWGEGKHPVWPVNETNKFRRWMWRDANGDGKVQSEEFSEFRLAVTYNLAFDVDENGDIWYGGQGKWTNQFQMGGTLHIRNGGLDAKGIPKFPLSGNSMEPIPFTELQSIIYRQKYLPKNDVMFLASGSKYPFSSDMWRVENWSDTARRKVTHWAIPYNDLGAAEIHLDQNSADMTLPMSFTADSEYVYIAYMDKGPDTRKRGEVTVLNAITGAKLGYIVPGPETDSISGAVDIPNGINVRILKDGSRLVYVEEDSQGKVMVYRWSPKASTPTGVPTSEPAPTGPLTVHRGPNSIEVTGVWNRATLRDLSGHALGTWASRGDGATESLLLPLGASSQTLVLTFLDRDGHRTSNLMAPTLAR